MGDCGGLLDPGSILRLLRNERADIAVAQKQEMKIACVFLQRAAFVVPAKHTEKVGYKIGETEAVNFV